MRPMQGAYEPRFLFDGNPVDGNPVDENGEYIERLFIPAYSYLHRSIPDSQLITYTAARGVRQLRFWRTYTQTIEVDASTVVLSIDGACRNNGGPVARASWGVYAGPGSRFNACGRLDASVPQTSSRAEIEALARALMVVTEIGREDRTLRNVKIRCDSEYLCKCAPLSPLVWRYASSLPMPTYLINMHPDFSPWPRSHVDVDRDVAKTWWIQVGWQTCCPFRQAEGNSPDHQ